jgi:hypothetical protein
MTAPTISPAHDGDGDEEGRVIAWRAHRLALFRVAAARLDAADSRRAVGVGSA